MIFHTLNKADFQDWLEKGTVEEIRNDMQSEASLLHKTTWTKEKQEVAWCHEVFLMLDMKQRAETCFTMSAGHVGHME